MSTLLLLVQPAEVLGLVEIPAHVRFWGIDSGIRHRWEFCNYVYFTYLAAIVSCFRGFIMWQMPHGPATLLMSDYYFCFSCKME